MIAPPWRRTASFWKGGSLFPILAGLSRYFQASSPMAMKILITGCAGFIGFHLSRTLLADGHQVVGADNCNAYYDPTLKHDRLEILRSEGLQFEQLDLASGEACHRLFGQKFDRVVHLAAQAGVRYSLENPQAYIDSNVTGFLNILEGCRHHEVGHLIYASSSSVYGANTQMPFAETQRTDSPVSLYGATKKANELMAHSYASTFGLPSTGLRFFTVYGPWGRPDMALYLFATAIMRGEPLKVFNHGRMRRDFTYIDDVLNGIVNLLQSGPPEPSNGVHEVEGQPLASAPAEVFNIGSHSPVELLQFIELIERNLGRQADKVMLPMQPGDVQATFADTTGLAERAGFSASTNIEDGIRVSMDWFKGYYAQKPEVFQ